MPTGPAIIDINVVVAGLLTNDASAPTALILDAMIQGQLIFVVSTELVAEYRSVLLRPRIAALHGLATGQVDDLLTTIVANAIVREINTSASAAPDPGDQHLWDLLASVPNAVRVTGDKALRDGAPASAAVLSPRAWISETGPSNP